MIEPMGFSQWKRELEAEDREDGLGHFDRPQEGLALLYRMYLQDFWRQAEEGGAQAVT